MRLDSPRNKGEYTLHGAFHFRTTKQGPKRLFPFLLVMCFDLVVNDSVLGPSLVWRLQLRPQSSGRVEHKVHVGKHANHEQKIEDDNALSQSLRPHVLAVLSCLVTENPDEAEDLPCYLDQEESEPDVEQRDDGVSLVDLEYLPATACVADEQVDD